MKRWSWVLGRCVAPLVLGGLVLVARPAPIAVPGPIILTAPGVRVEIAPWGGYAPMRSTGPQSTDRMLIERDGARFDPRFAASAPMMDRDMLVPPRVVGLPVGPGR